MVPRAANCGMPEYAGTTKEVNYAKYFALAGLKLESKEAEAPGAYLGLTRIQRSCRRA